MVDIRISKDIEASQEKVWEIVSDVDREPEFWHGTKSIKNIKKEGNVIEREVVIRKEKLVGFNVFHFLDIFLI